MEVQFLNIFLVYFYEHNVLYRIFISNCNDFLFANTDSFGFTRPVYPI